jgi:hypothetical protein
MKMRLTLWATDATRMCIGGHGRVCSLHAHAGIAVNLLLE